MARLSSTSASGTNPSIGVVGSTAPASAAEVAGVNASGNLEALSIDSNGALIVNTSGSFGVQNLNISYQEISAVSVGVETVINTYTAPAGKICYLLSILVSGQNIGQFNIYNNGTLFDKQYLSYTQFNTTFDYKTGASSVPGLVVASGNTISAKAINDGTSSALFSARLMILEVTP